MPCVLPTRGLRSAYGDPGFLLRPWESGQRSEQWPFLYYLPTSCPLEKSWMWSPGPWQSGVYAAFISGDFFIFAILQDDPAAPAGADCAAGAAGSH